MVKNNKVLKGVSREKIKSLMLVLTGSIYGVVIFIASICSAASYPTSTATPLANDLSMNQYKLTDVGDIITKGPWVDVRAYGVATTNTGAANTAALNNLFVSVPDGSTIVFPQGIFIFDPGIVLTGRARLRIEGQGTGTSEGGTQWRVTGSGNPTATLFEIVSSFSITISDIAFWGNNDNGPGKTGMGTYIRRGAGFTTQIKFVNCYWRFFEVGTQIGHLTVNEGNNENMEFYSCMWTFNTVGYRQYWQNSMQNAMYDCAFSQGGTNIWLANSTSGTSSLHLYNTNFSATSTTDIYFEKPASLYIYGSRSENSPSYISNSGLFGSPNLEIITLINVMVLAKTSPVTTPMIKISTGGLVAINCLFGGYTDTLATILSTVGTATLSFTGCQFNGLVGDVFSTTRVNAGILSFMSCRQWDGANGYVPVADNFDAIRRPLAGATPEVNKANTFYTANYSGPVTITNFIKSSGSGQVLYVFVSDSNTTIQNNANISLIGGVNVSPPDGGRMIFVLMDKWYEMSRSW